MVHKRPILFKNEYIYEQMCKDVFLPIISVFGVEKNEQIFRLEYFTKGVVGIINKWIELDCEKSIEDISKIIIDCVGYSQS